MSNNQYIYGNQNISGSLNIASGYTALIGNTTVNSNLLYRGLILQGGYSTTVQRQQNLMTFGALGTSYIDPNPFNDTAAGNDRNWHIGSISDTDYFQSPRFSFINSGSERLTILQNNGNVGIGTTNPLAKFVISSGSNENIEFIPGSTTYNGGVLEYINRTSETTRPDFNFFLNSVGGGAFKFFTNGANERMRINSSGNVGIGTTSPSYKLEVSGTIGVSNNLYWKSGDGVDWYIQGQANGPVIRMKYDSSTLNRNGALGWVDNSNVKSDILTWDNSKAYFNTNVGIGTSSPTIKLDVQEPTGTGNQVIGRFFAGTNTNGSAGGIALGSTQTTGGYIYGVQTAASSGDLVFGVQNLGSYAERMRILSNGNVGIGTTTSSDRLTVSGSVTSIGQLNNTNGSFLIDHPGVNTWKIGITDLNTSTLSIGNDYGGTFSNKALNITNTGNIGIGTTVPSSSLDIKAASAYITLTETGLNRTGKLGYTDGANLRLENDSASNTYIGTYNNLFLSYNGGNTAIGKTSANSTLDVNGNTIISGSLTITGSTNYINISGSVDKTAGSIAIHHPSVNIWRIGVTSTNTTTFSIGKDGDGSPFTDKIFNITNSGYVGLGKTSPIARLDVNGSAIISGSLSVMNGYNVLIGNATASSEAGLIIGPPPAGGTGEGGQLILQSTGGTYTSASMIDTYQNQFRILRGTNTTSDASLINVNLQNGNFGIGTASPNAKLDVNGDTIITGSLNFDITGTTRHAKIFTGTTPNPNPFSSTLISGYGASGTGLILQSGVTNVNNIGGIKITDSGVAIWGSGDTDLFRAVNEDSNDLKFVITNNGSVGIGMATGSTAWQLHLSTDSAAKPSTNTWTISSDSRIKENIIEADYDICYDIVKNLPLKRYTWKQEAYTTEQVTDRSKLGWIAQDVETVFPKAVSTYSFNGVGNFHIDDCKSLNSDQIYAAMYGTIKKLINENDLLKIELQSIKTHIGL